MSRGEKDETTRSYVGMRTSTSVLVFCYSELADFESGFLWFNFFMV